MHGCTATPLVSATFSFAEADQYELMMGVEKTLADRWSKHPDPSEHPTAGSYFQNPLIEGVRTSAGKLIEEAGCRSLKLGLARQWDKHANIIVAEERATSNHVTGLADILASKVRERFGISLVPEVRHFKHDGSSCSI